jgi:hypothetical protein
MRLVYALGVAGSSASVAREFSAAKAFVAFGLDYAGAVAYITFNNAFLRC